MRAYPETRRSDVRETLHGVEVADPYRWLEDADAPEVAEWVARQREATERELDALPERAWFAQVMDAVVTRPRAGVPIERGGHYFVSRNDGTTAQDVWFMADTLEELSGAGSADADAPGGTVVLDPNGWSNDGTAALASFAVSHDGRRMAYGVSDAGSDWQRFRVKDLTTGDDLDEPEVVGKFSVPRWLPDNASYLYTTFDEASDARGTATTGLGAARVMVHRLGDSTDADEVVFSLPDDPRVLPFAQVSHDGRWLVLTLRRGTEHVNRVWAHPLEVVDGRTVIGEPIRVADEPVAEFGFVRTDGDRLYLTTDLDAPRGRLVSVDLGWAAQGDIELAEVVPEITATLAGVVPFGEDFLVAYLHDAQTLVVHVQADGLILSELELPGGSLVGLDGSPDHTTATVGISTLDAPTAAYQVDAPPPGSETPAGVEPLDLALPVDAVAPPYSVVRRRAESADGTEVPYFLVVPDGGGDGPRPTLLWGYGGFKVPVLADYRPGWSAWLRAGGVLALANLRGGGEYGTPWYEDGRGPRKQNVFDDAIGVAEHLVASGVTTPGQLAIHGRSNGGLLVGAAITQRPELFAAALPTVGVLDLLRFHKFTIGAAWVSDYGDPDEPEAFAAAMAYSPLHNVRDGVRYPATLISTADHDDRVVPLHSFKFGAALQRAQGGDAPVLLRIESSAGHGAGKPLQRVADEWADLLAFAAHHTGLQPNGHARVAAEVAG